MSASARLGFQCRGIRCATLFEKQSSQFSRFPVRIVAPEHPGLSSVAILAIGVGVEVRVGLGRR